MQTKLNVNLRTHKTPGAEVHTDPRRGGWRLEIPAGPKGQYRLAQLDDFTAKKRVNFPWPAPITLSLRARVSTSDIPGTWGFGLWNDPFSLSLGLGGGTRRFPALPNAAWFFGASRQNYLSLRDDLSANGLIAQTFQFLLPFSKICYPKAEMRYASYMSKWVNGKIWAWLNLRLS